MMTSQHNHLARFELSTPNPEKKNPRETSTMDDLEDWVSNFGKRDFRYRPEDKPLSEIYKEVDRNFTSKITHAGFISYLHLCWAKELGCELRPDMLYYTILSEIASCVLKNPEKYKHLFTDSQEKENIIVTSVNSDIDVNLLVDEMRKVVKAPDFLSAVCDVSFESDVPNASYARKMTFACMGTPFYSYLTAMCGIPRIDIIGNEKDWKSLESAVITLRRIFEHGELGKYLQIVRGMIFDIIHNRFSATPDDARSFFNDIFNYGPNTECGSGHPDNIVHGWAKLFYIDGQYDETSLGSLPAHVNYVPYFDADTDKSYCKTVALAFSELDEQAQILRSGYGIITYEVTDEDVYNKIANPPRKDSNGKEYQPLSLKKLHVIVDEGKFYNPANLHYGGRGYVICDRCRKRPNICIGHGKNNDLCLPCTDWVNNEWTRIYGNTDK